MKTRSKNSCCIGRHADKAGPHPSLKNQVEVEKCASGTKLPKDSLKGHQNCVKANSGPSEASKSSTKKMTLKDKNGHGRNAEKSWKPTNTQNITPQIKVILNKHIKSGEKRI